MRDERDWIKLEQENRELQEKVTQQGAEIARRDEVIEQLQQTIAQLLSKAEQATHQEALVAQLQKTIAQLTEEMQRVKADFKEVQDRLSKDSHNSHLPPSSDRFGKPKKTKSLRKASGNKPGGQVGHEGSTLCQVSHPDQIITHRVSTCSACECDLQSIAAFSVERRQVFDIPPKRVVVIEHQAEQKVCPDCHGVTCASEPSGVSAPVQYSPAFGAIAVYLTQQQFLPYERACETIQDLIGPAMTVGTLKNMVQRCALNLEPIEEQIKEHLRKGDVLHHDETSLSVMGKRWWGHVAATSQLTHYAVHAKRGREAMNAIGILPKFTGTCIHDALATYFTYSDCTHGLCNEHHGRELTYLAEEHKQVWAEEMHTLLLDMNAAVKEARDLGLEHLHPDEEADWNAQYEALLSRGYQANPPDPPEVSAPVKRGRRKQSAARNLLDRLSKHQGAVLRFLEDFSVPFTNNQAERDIRMVKVQQKISGGFRSLPGAQAFFRIRGYLSTLRKQGAHVLTALELALAGYPVSPTF
jgi:transposase